MTHASGRSFVGEVESRQERWPAIGRSSRGWGGGGAVALCNPE